ncbi:MAG: hypothetical protein HYU97_01965 [Deltaproteobacteria bacterium]|nr:hypothetical protein [Deltaproteobacteria bacterium]
MTIAPSMLADLQKEFSKMEFVIASSVDEYFNHLSRAEIIWSNVFPVGFPQNTLQLKWFHTTTTHTGGQIPETAFRSSVFLTNNRSVYAENASEMVMAYLLIFAKQFVTLYTAQQQKTWLSLSQFPEKHRIRSLMGQTLGIVGFGAMGQSTAKKAKMFGMKVIASDINPTLNTALLDEFYLDDLKPIFVNSDYVLIALPLCPSTQGIISDKLLAQMKETACLINLSLGQVLDEIYLYNMLKYKDIAAAVLDSFQMQPLPPIHPFFELDNLLITPHVACYDQYVLTKLITHFRMNLTRYLAGETLIDPIPNYDYV